MASERRCFGGKYRGPIRVRTEPQDVWKMGDLGTTPRGSVGVGEVDDVDNAGGRQGVASGRTVSTSPSTTPSSL